MYKARRPDLWPPIWRRRPLPVSLAVLMVVGSAWARWGSSPPDDYAKYHGRTFTCIRAVDGDTIDLDVPDGKLNHTRVRLWGIKTPEIGKRDSAAMYHADGTSTLIGALTEHQLARVVLPPQQTRDRYGRLLAYVYVRQGAEEVMLNEEVVARGYAYADRRSDHHWRLRFEQLEDRAHKQGLGLWDQVRTEQMPARRQRHLQSESSQRRENAE